MNPHDHDDAEPSSDQDAVSGQGQEPDGDTGSGDLARHLRDAEDRVLRAQA